MTNDKDKLLEAYETAKALYQSRRGSYWLYNYKPLTREQQIGWVVNNTPEGTDFVLVHEVLGGIIGNGGFEDV